MKNKTQCWQKRKISKITSRKINESFIERRYWAQSSYRVVKKVKLSPEHDEKWVSCDPELRNRERGRKRNDSVHSWLDFASINSTNRLFTIREIEKTRESEVTVWVWFESRDKSTAFPSVKSSFLFFFFLHSLTCRAQRAIIFSFPHPAPIRTQ